MQKNEAGSKKQLEKEEERDDVKDARKALAEAKKKGAIPLEKLIKELGL